MNKFFFKAAVVVQVMLLFMHLYYNRHGLPIPPTDNEAKELIELMRDYQIDYSFKTKRTMDQTIWGYDLTWASFVIFTILMSWLALKLSSLARQTGKYIAGSASFLWLCCAVVAFMFWSPPQQMIFSTLFVLFFISFLREWNEPKAKKTRVCVVGGGISGLTAAYQLTKKGYSEVTVLERENYVGGKCKTLVRDERPFDLGGHEMLGGYNEVISMAKELNAPSRVSISPLVYDSNKKAYLDFMQSAAASGHYSKLQVMWASMKYLWLVGITFRKLSQPSTGFKNMPAELTMNLNDWLKHRNIEAIKDILVFVIKVQGYGRFETTPACYLLKFQGFRNWSTLLLSGMGINKNWPRVFTYGMENLCDRLAANVMDVRTGVTINHVERTNASQGGIKVFIEGKSEPQIFDKLIVSTPFDHGCIDFLDLDEAEKKTFSEFKTYKFYTTFAKAEGLAAGVVASNPMNNIEAGEYTGYIKDFTEDNHVIFFTLALSDAITGEVVKERINDVLKRVVPYKGVQPKVLEFLYQKSWNYFPHVEGEKVGDVLNAVENLQGKKNTYYSSSALTFECVGNSVAYAIRLVKENF